MCNTSIYENPESAKKESEEAKECAEKFKSCDPFTSTIPPALLNSVDIYKYIKHISLIHPFCEKGLKAASYEMHLGGEIHSWMDDGKKQVDYLKKDDNFIIPQNSIIFVTTEESFYLPYYIAARFNLIIKHVHQGMLLGTGPLVNPGYYGRLVIPIHNLTCNPYTLKVGAPIISVEFTKISPHKQWRADVDYPSITYENEISYKENDSEYREADFNKYLARATENVKMIRSSFAGLKEEYEKEFLGYKDKIKDMTDAYKSLTDKTEHSLKIHSKKYDTLSKDLKFESERVTVASNEAVEKVSNKLNLFSLSALIATVLGLIAAVISLHLLYGDIQTFFKSSSEAVFGRQDGLMEKLEEQNLEIEKLKFELETLKAQHPEILNSESPETPVDDGQQTRERKSYEAVFTDMRNNRGR